MAKRQIQFTQEQIEILLKNPNVADATTNTIKFTPEFKKLALQKTEEGMSPNDIFKEAGFDLKLLGKRLLIIVSELGNFTKDIQIKIIPNILQKK